MSKSESRFRQALFNPVVVGKILAKDLFSGADPGFFKGGDFCKEGWLFID